MATNEDTEASSRKFFESKQVPWLKDFLHERGIQTSSDGKSKRKAELVELSLNAKKMKLPKIVDGDHEEKGKLLSELRRTNDGVLPNPDSVKWNNNFANCPQLTFIDICNYLVGKSDYNHESLKSFKSLQGYRLFKDGHVLDQKLHVVENMNHAYVKFHVKPTERSKVDGGNKTYYEGLIFLKNDGSIHGAFCPCLGGADGSCRHVAASLFDIENTVRLNTQVTCTSRECVWKRQAKPNENASAMTDLKIIKSEYGKKERKSTKPTDFDPRSLKHDPVVFLENLKEGLMECSTSSVILQVLPQSKAVDVNEEELTEMISKGDTVEHEEEVVAEEINTIMEMRDIFLSSKGIDTIKTSDITDDLCKEFTDFIALTQNQALMIFDKTIDQGNTAFWMNQRQGRLTGSNFYRICHLKESTNKANILKDLMGYCPLPAEKQPIQFEWGHEKETAAINLYKKKMEKKHKHVAISSCGLVINPSWPYLGASPDGFRYCKCCGKIVLEVKSLYAKRSLLPHVAAQEFVVKENGVFHLKKETRWYYQIQGELAVTKLHDADLVVYTNKGIMVVRVKFDPDYWHLILTKLQNFYKAYMIPEILSQEVKRTVNNS